MDLKLAFNSQIMGWYEICWNTYIFFLYKEVPAVVKMLLLPSSVLLAHLHLIVLIPPKFIYQYSLFFRHSFHCLLYLILYCGTTLTCSCVILLPGQRLSPFPGLQLCPCPDCSVRLPRPTFPSMHFPLTPSFPFPPDPISNPHTHLSLGPSSRANTTFRSSPCPSRLSPPIDPYSI